MAKEIFVVEAGFVFVCDNATLNGSDWTLEGAQVIRRWGTTAGLGQIALSGPTKNTVLDPCGTATVPAGKVLFRLPCTGW